MWRERVRSAVGLARSTVRRDRRKRAVKRADACLSYGVGLRPARFEAPWLGTVRTLPSVETALTTDAARRRELQARVVSTCAVRGLNLWCFVEGPSQRPILAVADESWSEVLGLLAEIAPYALVGKAGIKSADYSSATLSPTPSVNQFNEDDRVFLVEPAVTKWGDSVVGRYGFESGIVLERWRRDEEGMLAPPAWNPYTSRVLDGALNESSEEDLVLGLSNLMEPPNLFDVTFPVDVVYTWVDGTDSAWLARKRQAVEQSSGEDLTEEAAADMRFIDHDELRYSLRSIERYAPWIRHIWIVTDRQRPAWLDTEHPKITMVDHADIAPEGTELPTFNSHAIEANLHRISGLSEHFLYFNDDVFLSSPVGPDLFFSPNGIAHMYLSKALVAPGDPVAGEPASDSAGKNARRMVMEVCGRYLSRKLFHAPFALQRSVSEEIEGRWPDDVQTTRNQKFRQIGDVTLSGALHMNYAYAVGKAVTRGLRYRYVNVGAPDALARFEKLYADRHVLQTFCLNEATQDRDPGEIDRSVRDFLQRMFPDVSTFEVLD